MPVESGNMPHSVSNLIADVDIGPAIYEQLNRWVLSLHDAVH